MQPHDFYVRVGGKLRSPIISDVSAESQQVHITVAIDVLASREPQVLCAIYLLRLAGEIALPVVEEEAGISPIGRIMLGRERGENVDVAIMVEIVAVKQVIHSRIAIDIAVVKLTVTLVNHHIQLCTRENIVGESVVIEVSRLYDTTDVELYPFAIAHILVQEAVFLIHEVDVAVCIKVQSTGDGTDGITDGRRFLCVTAFRSSRQTCTTEIHTRTPTGVGYQTARTGRVGADILRIGAYPFGLVELRHKLVVGIDLHVLFAE